MPHQFIFTFSLSHVFVHLIKLLYHTEAFLCLVLAFFDGIALLVSILDGTVFLVIIIVEKIAGGVIFYGW